MIPEGADEWLQYAAYKLSITTFCHQVTQELPRLAQRDEDISHIEQLDQALEEYEELLDNDEVGLREHQAIVTKVFNLQKVVESESYQLLQNKLAELKTMPTKTLNKLLDRRQEESSMPFLLDTEGKESDTQEASTDILLAFYGKLFAQPQHHDAEAVLQMLPLSHRRTMPEKDKQMLLAPFTIEEMSQTIKKSNKNAMPGEDGLPINLYDKCPESL